MIMPCETTKKLKCECGKPLSADDAKYWGECEKCRRKLPIQSAQRGDSGSSGSQADRSYHGGLGSRGEW